MPREPRMKVVVTGASGFLGSHIARAFIDAGHEVVAAVRNPKKAAFLEAWGVRLATADLTDPASLVAAFHGADAVISNAALGSNQGDMQAFERVNCQGVRDLFDAAHEAGVPRIVHISSVAVYRTRLFAAMDEATRPYDPERRRFNWSDATTDWRYARTKTLSENIAWERAAAHGIALTTLRPGPIYGSRDDKATAKLVAQLTTTRVRFVPTVGVPWVHAGDVAGASRTALTRPESIGKAYNVAGPPVSQARFMRAMRRALTARGEVSLARLIPLPVPIWVRYDTGAAERDLGFSSRAIEDGLAEALGSSAR